MDRQKLLETSLATERVTRNKQTNKKKYICTSFFLTKVLLGCERKAPSAECDSERAHHRAAQRAPQQRQRGNHRTRRRGKISQRMTMMKDDVRMTSSFKQKSEKRPSIDS